MKDIDKIQLIREDCDFALYVRPVKYI